MAHDTTMYRLNTLPKSTRHMFTYNKRQLHITLHTMYIKHTALYIQYDNELGEFRPLCFLHRFCCRFHCTFIAYSPVLTKTSF